MSIPSLKDKLSLVALILSLSGTVMAGGVFYADSRYVTHRSMSIKEIREIERKISLIARKSKYKQAQPYELDYMDDLILEVKHLKRQLTK